MCTNLSNMWDSLKVDIFLCCKQNTGLQTILFIETAITGYVYLNMLEHYIDPHVDVNSVIWQQDEAQSHYHEDVMRSDTWTKYSWEDGLVMAAIFHDHPDHLTWHPSTFLCEDKSEHRQNVCCITTGSHNERM
jgi:hypothetical protein